MRDNDRSLDDLLRQVKQMHQISKDIDDTVNEDLKLLDEITERTTDATRHMELLRRGIEGIKVSARVVKKYHLFIAVGFAFVFVVYLLVL